MPSVLLLLPTLYDVLSCDCVQPVMSDHGLLTTVAYKLGKDDPACYALEVCESFLLVRLILVSKLAYTLQQCPPWCTLVCYFHLPAALM